MSVPAVRTISLSHAIKLYQTQIANVDCQNKVYEERREYSTVGVVRMTGDGTVKYKLPTVGRWAEWVVDMVATLEHFCFSFIANFYIRVLSFVSR